jgi:hypothetical protein
MSASTAIWARGPGIHQWKLLPAVKVRWPWEMASAGLGCAWAGAIGSSSDNTTTNRLGTAHPMVHPWF